MWAIENPATGLLKTRSFMEHLPWLDVTYCQYGTPYRKQTRLSNMLWRPSRKLCKPGNRCDAWVDGRHRRAAGATAPGKSLRACLRAISRTALQHSGSSVRRDWPLLSPRTLKLRTWRWAASGNNAIQSLDNRVLSNKPSTCWRA